MFTLAESAVVAYLEQGLSSREIAEQLALSEKGVKFHLTKIFKKENVKTRSEFLAKRNGLTTQKRSEMMSDLSKPMEQGARAVRVVEKNQEDKIMFIDEKFKVGATIVQLHKMMTEVTKEEISPSTVNAACNCVARLNETINTAIQAARFLNER